MNACALGRCPFVARVKKKTHCGGHHTADQTNGKSETDVAHKTSSAMLTALTLFAVALISCSLAAPPGYLYAGPSSLSNCSGVWSTTTITLKTLITVRCPGGWDDALAYVHISGGGMGDSMTWSDSQSYSGSGTTNVGMPCSDQGNNPEMHLPAVDIYRGQWIPCQLDFTLSLTGTCQTLSSGVSDEVLLRMDYVCA